MRIGNWLFFIALILDPLAAPAQENKKEANRPVLIARTPELLVHGLLLDPSLQTAKVTVGDERLAIVATEVDSGEMTILHSSGIRGSVSRAGGTYETRIIGAIATSSHLYVAEWTFGHGHLGPVEALKEESLMTAGYGAVRYWGSHKANRMLGDYTLFVYALPRLQPVRLTLHDGMPDGVPKQTSRPGALSIDGEKLKYFGKTYSIPLLNRVKN
jgi:hypothetical protein